MPSLTLSLSLTLPLPLTLTLTLTTILTTILTLRHGLASKHPEVYVATSDLLDMYP